jgi:hypothetical protein
VAALCCRRQRRFAHDDATLDKMKWTQWRPTAHGRRYHFELVVAKDSKEAKDNPVTVYLTDHGEKGPRGGRQRYGHDSGRESRNHGAAVPGRRQQADGNRQYASDPQMKVVVSITLADRKTEQARFTPLTMVAADGHGDHRQ